MKIKTRLTNPNCGLRIYEKGEWVDLRVSEKMSFKAPTLDEKTNKVVFDHKLIPLGIAMELPKYFEANIVPRSSTFKNFKILLSNSYGVVDSSYCGNEDVWRFGAIALEETTVEVGDRIAQFRIRPSQFAPWWVKLKWLFTNKVKFEIVDFLNNNNRGGFGTTGKN